MFKAIFTNSFGILFSRILGFLRDLLMASSLGASIYSDIFFIAFKLPNLFRRIFAEGAFTQTFIPSWTKSKHKGVFLIYIFFLFLAIIITLSILVTIFPKVATKLIAIGFDKDTINIASIYVAINFWYLPLIFMVTFIASMLQYKHHFATTAFSTALLNISLILALIISKDKPDSQIVLYLSYGVIIGGIMQLFTHIIALKRLGLCKVVIGGIKYYRTKKRFIKKDTTNFTKQFFPSLLGNSTAQLSAFIDTWLASFLATGAISYLYYSNRVFQLPLSLFAIATSVAIFPKVSRYLKHNNNSEAIKYMQKAFWFLLYLLTFSTIGGFILSYEIVDLLFLRGAFNTNDAINTALVLKMYMIGLLPLGLNKLFLLWLYAKEQQKKSAKIASISLISNIILSLTFISSYGAMGLALASSLSGFLSFYLVLKEFGFKEFKKFLKLKEIVLFIVFSSLFSISIVLFKDIYHIILK